MREIVRELVDALHSLKAISDNRRSELHAELDQGDAGPTAEAPSGGDGSADSGDTGHADEPAGA